jgi:hypothetical protein
MPDLLKQVIDIIFVNNWLTTSFRRYIILEKGVNMGDPQLEQLRTEFLTLEARERDYILGVSSALALPNENASVLRLVK